METIEREYRHGSHPTKWHSKVLDGVEYVIKNEPKINPLSDEKMAAIVRTNLVDDVTAYHVAVKRKELGFGDSMSRRAAYLEKGDIVC